MGVPKFYRWLSERYPCLSEVVADGQIPEFDNLYFDMNGIIHGCSHPNDEDVSFRISEEQIFRDIFYYIETLFGIICPRKVFFMAIDGVAPRAKMNQQRARRFMSAKNADTAVKVAKSKGIEIPEEERFDSNCITPGTPFMSRLHTQLQYFIQYKITTDTTWQGIRIYLSGHNCPGEGEHKIMDFIRSERSKPGYDPNTRHCLYGLDADLIMLGACSHEPHFSLLREEVQFGRPRNGSKTQKNGVDEITFHLLHISLLREYLGLEFQKLKDKISFNFDLESIIDDWVMMGFLVGNDFIPHLPYVHIHQDGLDALYSTYLEVLPQLDGYINESGVLNLRRFEIYLKAFAKNDRRCFFDEMDDQRYMESKRSKNAFRSRRVEEKANLVSYEMSETEDTSDASGDASSSEPDAKGAFDSDSDSEAGDEQKNEDVATEETEGNETDILPSASAALDELSDEAVLTEEAVITIDGETIAIPLADENFENDCDLMWTTSVNRAFKNHKRDYYNEKMKYKNISKEQLREQAEGYVRAIQWNLHYYYHGCCSWNWFYPHHYAPYISDVVDFSDMKLDFDLSKPFHPFEQLLAVLPAASADCLPVPFQELMLDEASPISDFYPRDFMTDLNGKKNDWEAVVLIPFIEEKRLLDAMATKEDRLTEEERFRNSYGPHLLFTTDRENPILLSSTFPGVFDDLPNCIAKKEEISMDEFRIERSRIVHGLLPNVRLDVYFPGFPTMKHIPHTGELRHADVCVFRQPTLKKSMIISISERTEFDKDPPMLAADLVGKEVYVEWPLLKKGLVHQFWSPDQKWFLDAENACVCKELDESEKKSYEDYCSSLFRREFKRYGIDVGKRKGIVFVRPLLGTEYVAQNKKMITQKVWSSEHEAKSYSLPLVVQNVVEESGVSHTMSTIDEAFPSGSTAFFCSTTTKFYGYRVEVESSDMLKKQSMLKVRCELPVNDVDLTYLASNIRKFSLSWFHASEVARRTSLSKNIIHRITGYVPLSFEESRQTSTTSGYNEKLNIGLDFKNCKRNLVVPDYARRTAEGAWEYSFNSVRVIQEYKKRFPEIFRHLEHPTKLNEAYRAENIWSIPDERAKRLRELRDFLKSVPSASVSMQSADGYYLDANVIQELERQVAFTGTTWRTKRLGVKPNMLFRHELHTGNTIPDPGATYELLDRVVCVRPLRGTPFAKVGTVVGIFGSDDKQILEVLFDECHLGGKCIRGSKKSGCRLSPFALINITHGQRARQEVEVPKPNKTSNAEKTTFWGPDFYHPNTRHPVALGVNSSLEDPSGVPQTSSESTATVQKFRLLTKETVSPEKLLASLASSECKDSPVCQQQPNTSLSESSTNDTQLTSIAQLVSSMFGTSSKTEAQTTQQEIESPEECRKEESTNSKPYGEFMSTEKDSERRFEELLAKLKLRAEKEEKKNPKFVPSVKATSSFGAKSTKSLSNIKGTSVRAGGATIRPIGQASDSANQLAFGQLMRPPMFSLNSILNQREHGQNPELISEQLISQPAMVPPRTSSLGFSFADSKNLPVMPYLQFAPRPRMQSQRNQRVSAYNTQRMKQLDPSIRFRMGAPSRPAGAYFVPSNWQRNQPRWGCPTAAFSVLGAGPRFGAPPAPCPRPMFTDRPNFMVPSSMTPTQVIRKKVSITKDDEAQKPSTSGAVEMVEAPQNRDNSVVVVDAESAEENAGPAHITASDVLSNAEKTPQELSPKADFGLPDFDALPELKIVKENVIVACSALPDVNGSSKGVSAATSETSLYTAASEDTGVSEKTGPAASVSGKSKFKGLGGRKSRVAAKFN